MHIEEIRQLRELMNGGSASNEILSEIRETLSSLSPRNRHWTEYITSLSGLVLATLALLGIGSKAYLELRGDLDALMHSKAAIELELSKVSIHISESTQDIKKINETLIEYRVKEELKERN
jgi:hypothetical protein